ncbi:ABC transporter permease [Pandoraea iniqua]|nr:ABC transporter permease [Pandoraea iniqua]
MPEPVRVASRHRWHQLLRRPSFQAGLVIVLFWGLCALVAPMLPWLDAYCTDPMNALLPPSFHHWFGTDQIGRDVFARVLVGSRDILTIAPLATVIGTVLGTALGLALGYFGGRFDAICSRVLDAILALPMIIVALLALTALGPSNTTIVLIIGMSFAPITARTVRSAVLGERSLDYVKSAQLRGESSIYIMFVEILPNVVAPILVEATVRLGYGIFAVATLSFLGFGVQPPSPDWGLAMANNYTLMASGAWWTVAFNAIAIASMVIAIHLLADNVQEVSAQ